MDSNAKPNYARICFHMIAIMLISWCSNLYYIMKFGSRCGHKNHMFAFIDMTFL